VLTGCEGPAPEGPPPLVRVTLLAGDEEDPEGRLAPLERVLMGPAWDEEGAGVRLAPLLRVATTGTDGAARGAPLERVIAEDAAAPERDGAPPDAPPELPAPAPATFVRWWR
jgi:hypothetical protein